MASLLVKTALPFQTVKAYPSYFCQSVRWKQHVRPRLEVWERRQRDISPPVIKNIPDKHKRYEPDMEHLTTLEHTLKSLKHSGFHRPYTPYDPPQDMESRFFKVCAEILPDGLPNDSDLSKINLDSDLSLKSKLMSSLAKELNGHVVPNSMLHTITSLDQVFHFYSVKVDLKTPYERLEAATKTGDLPANLHIQLDAHRFDPETGTSDFDLVTAFPRSSTIMVTPEARRKYKDVIAKHPPWKMAPE